MCLFREVRNVHTVIRLCPGRWKRNMTRAPETDPRLNDGRQRGNKDTVLSARSISTRGYRPHKTSTGTELCPAPDRNPVSCRTSMNGYGVMQGIGRVARQKSSGSNSDNMIDPERVSWSTRWHRRNLSGSRAAAVQRVGFMSSERVQLPLLCLPQ